MRQLITIVLIILLLFNVLGYYGLFIGLRYQHKQALKQRFDQGRYNAAEAITIKVPLSVPYAGDQPEYERVDGEFEHRGEFYRIVKQRLSHDTLYVVCVNDKHDRRIHQALADYVKTFTDKPSTTKSGQSIPTLSKDYFACAFLILHAVSGWEHVIERQGMASILIASYYPSVVHPPERG